MAEAANSTVSRIPHPKDAAIGRLAREWEADICDMFDCADITTDLFDSYTEMPENERYSISAQGVRNLKFLTFSLRQRIERFKDEYYRALEA